jgi:hypothetical protein
LGIQEEAKEYCSGCVKYYGGQCTAFTELYPLWGKGECWGRETEPHVWLEKLREMVEYREHHNGRGASEDVAREIRRMESLVLEKAYEDFDEVYNLEVHRPNIKKGGGGSEADKVNKQFGPQTMKNNKFAHRRNNPSKFRDWDNGRGGVKW